MPIASNLTLHRITIILLALCVCLGAPAAALADGQAVLRDCNDNGKLDKKYKQSDYRDAIENIPTDLDEYTDCRDVIRRAQLGLSGSGGTSPAGGTGGGGTSTPGAGPATGAPSANATEALSDASPQERAALAAKAAAGSAAIRVGGELLEPGKLRFSGVSSSTSLPTPLIIVLVLLSGAGIASAGYAVRNRVSRR
jgi:hypothetical protein